MSDSPNLNKQSTSEQNTSNQSINKQSTSEQNTSNQSINEQRIRKIALIYYSRKDILDAIYKFSKNREVSPRYFEGFGKRPDSFQYPSDILAFVKRGATSFHSSEELWENPMEISTEMNELQLKELRTGWDLLIDIDCPWLDFSKKAAQAIIQALESQGVKNIGVKYSGSKGFHIIIPWKAFPEKIDEINVSDMFPEYPRAIVGFLKEKAHPLLTELIKDMKDDFTKVKGFIGIECKECHNLASENYQITFRCDNHSPPYIETSKLTNKDKIIKKCPQCKKQLKQTQTEKFYVCNHCNTDSLEFPNEFSKTPTKDIFKILGLDIQLVSSRHLFRMPYSLHEKTSLASIVIPKEKIEQFEIKDADPLAIQVKEFLPEPEKNEAKQLLMQAIDWQSIQDLKKQQIEQEIKQQNNQTNQIYDEFQSQTKKQDFKPIKIINLNEKDFPPTITNILKGMTDGKKRGLFILINFYKSLGQSIDDIEKNLKEWNKKNNPPIKQGYINAQLSWHSKHKAVLPPNFDNEIYKEIGVLELDNLSKKVKNPVNYVVTKSGFWKGKKK